MPSLEVCLKASSHCETGSGTSHVGPQTLRRSVNPATPPDTGWDALLFDLDGTLADTIEIILACYRHTMRTHLGRVLPDAEWLATMGAPLRTQLRAFARSTEEAEEMTVSYQAHQLDIHDARVRPYPGVRDVLETLVKVMPLGVVTGKRREMALRTLRCCDLQRYFTVLISADDAPTGKPDPAPVIAALDALGSPDAAAVLFVGDSPFDIAAGRSAAVRTAAALWGPFAREVLEAAGPDYFLPRIESLLALPGIMKGRAGP